jgi:LysM repeat protein
MSLPPKDKEELGEADQEVASLIARTSLASLGMMRSPPKNTSGNVKRVDPPPAGFQHHVLTKADTLAGLAVRYQTTTEELKKVNKLWSERDMLVRSTLLVPIVLDEMALARERDAKVLLFGKIVNREVSELVARALLAKSGWNVDRAVAMFEESEEADRLQQQQLSDAAERAQRDALLRSSSNNQLNASYSSAEEELSNPTGFFGKVENGTQQQSKKMSEEDMFNEL